MAEAAAAQTHPLKHPQQWLRPQAPPQPYCKDTNEHKDHPHHRPQLPPLHGNGDNNHNHNHTTPLVQAATSVAVAAGATTDMLTPHALLLLLQVVFCVLN
jgi:hypothetical protein